MRGFRVMDYLSKEGFHKSQQFKLYRDYYTEFSIRQLTLLFHEIYPKPFEKLKIEEEVYYKIAPFEDYILKLLKDNSLKNINKNSKVHEKIEAHRDISDENGFEECNDEISFQCFYNNRNNKFSDLGNKYDPNTWKISREHCIELCKLFGFNPKVFLPKEEQGGVDEVAEKKERKLQPKQEAAIKAKAITAFYYKIEESNILENGLMPMQDFINSDIFQNLVCEQHQYNEKVMKRWVKDDVPEEYRTPVGRPRS